MLFLYFYNFHQTGTYTFSIQALYQTAPHIFHDPAYGSTFAILLFLAFFLEGRTKTMGDWKHTLLPAVVPTLLFLLLIVACVNPSSREQHMTSFAA